MVTVPALDLTTSLRGDLTETGILLLAEGGPEGLGYWLAQG